MGWPYIARPVQVGGLGILDLDRFSRALRLRWLWLAWSEVRRPWDGMKLPVDETDVALFTATTRVTVHNGQRASFWLSNWIDGRSPTSLFPLLFQHSRRKHRSVHDALADGHWINDLAHDLNVELLRDLFNLS